MGIFYKFIWIFPKLNVAELYRKILKNLKSWVCWSVGIIIMLLALSNGLMRRINALFASHLHVNLKVSSGRSDIDSYTFWRNCQLFITDMLSVIKHLVPLIIPALPEFDKIKTNFIFTWLMKGKTYNHYILWWSMEQYILWRDFIIVFMTVQYEQLRRKWNIFM